MSLSVTLPLHAATVQGKYQDVVDLVDNSNIAVDQADHVSAYNFDNASFQETTMKHILSEHGSLEVTDLSNNLESQNLFSFHNTCTVLYTVYMNFGLPELISNP